MLSSLSGCALEKKIASSSSSLLQLFTGAPRILFWVHCKSSQALGCPLGTVGWEGLYGPSTAHEISHSEILLLLCGVSSCLGWDCLQGTWGKRIWAAGRSDASLGLRALLCLRAQEPECC